MQIVYTEPNQTIYDVAVQHYGTAEAVGELWENNPALANDPEALLGCGIDPDTDSGFYWDIAIAARTPLSVDTDSYRMQQSVLREMSGIVTTFNL